MKTLFVAAFTSLAFSVSVLAQDTLMVEDFGVPVGQVPINAFTGWDEKTVTYDGTAFLRCLATSSTCSVEIQQGNVLFSAGQYLQVNGIKTQGDGAIRINFVMYNRYAMATSDSLKFYVSSDKQIWAECFLFQFPKYAGWAPQQIDITLPRTDKFYFKIVNTSKKCMYWVDHLVVTQSNPRSASTTHSSDAYADNVQFKILNTDGGKCRIDLQEKAHVRVYSILGNELLSMNAQAGLHEIPLAKGVYIVMINKTSKKIIVR